MIEDRSRAAVVAVAAAAAAAGPAGANAPAVADGAVRGACGWCGFPVTTKQRREKDQAGTYYHIEERDCAVQIRTRGPEE